jgi:predicted lipid-binding transport protein (Tim44 family)
MKLDPSLIIFALLAMFVLWKLRSVLGERTGYDPKDDPAARFPARANGPAAAAAPVARPDEARWSAFTAPNSAVWQGFDAILLAQPGFEPQQFLDGARAAYEMVVQAFSRGDEATLRSLASDDVFNSFKAAIADRTQRGDKLETTFVGFNSVKIVEARMEETAALISVQFDTQFVTATRDKTGAVIEGDPTQPSNIVDVWSFARRNGASGPNWIIVSTAPAH